MLVLLSLDYKSQLKNRDCKCVTWKFCLHSCIMLLACPGLLHVTFVSYLYIHSLLGILAFTILSGKQTKTML